MVKSRVTIASLNLSSMANQAAKPPVTAKIITIAGPTYLAGVTHEKLRGSCAISDLHDSQNEGFYLYERTPTSQKSSELGAERNALELPGRAARPREPDSQKDAARLRRAYAPVCSKRGLNSIRLRRIARQFWWWLSVELDCARARCTV